MVKPLQGNGLTLSLCEGCGGLSVVITLQGEPIAYVCPPDEALIQLAEVIAESIQIQANPETVQ